MASSSSYVDIPGCKATEAVNVCGLKNNPSEALRLARRDVVVVMNRDRPAAWMVGVESSGVLGALGVRPALATALFRDGHLSLTRAARLATMSVADFAAHLSRLGIPVTSSCPRAWATASFSPGSMLSNALPISYLFIEAWPQSFRSPPWPAHPGAHEGCAFVQITW